MYLVPNAPEMSKTDVVRKIRDRSDYLASNAMGVQVKVHEVDSEAYGFASKPEAWPNRISHDNSEGLRIPLPMPSDEAAKVKDFLRVVYVGNMVEPWIGRDVFSVDPTVSDPYKLLESQDYVFFKPKEIIVFRADTGEILLRNAGHSF